MAPQAFLKTNGATRRNQPEGMLEGVQSFGTNVTHLALLQSRLVGIDLAEAGRNAAPAIVALSLSLFALPAAFVMAALGLALWLINSQNMAPLMACVVVCMAVLVTTALTAWLALRSIRRCLRILRRSGEEFDRNLSWLRTVLTQSGR